MAFIWKGLKRERVDAIIDLNEDLRLVECFECRLMTKEYCATRVQGIGGMMDIFFCKSHKPAFEKITEDYRTGDHRYFKLIEVNKEGKPVTLKIQKIRIVKRK